jgi:hypothetical protein
MGVVCRLREYTAEDENRYETLVKRAGLACAALLGAATLVLAFLFTGGTGEKTTQACTEYSPPALARAPHRVRFNAKNWTFLESAPRTVRPADPGVEDLESPDWAHRTAYKDLKAMTIYELDPPPRKEGQSQGMADLLKGRRS